MNLVIVTWIPRITFGFIFLFDDNQLYKKQKKLNLLCRTFLPSSVHGNRVSCGRKKPVEAAGTFPADAFKYYFVPIPDILNDAKN